MNWAKSILLFLKEVFITRTNGYVDIRNKLSFWSHFAENNNGVLKIKHTVSKDLTTLHIIIPREFGQIEIWESDTKPFKIYCQFETCEELRFSVIKKDSIGRFCDNIQPNKIHDFDKEYQYNFQENSLKEAILGSPIFINFIRDSNLFSITANKHSQTNMLEISATFGRAVQSENDMKSILHFFQFIIYQVLDHLGINNENSNNKNEY